MHDIPGWIISTIVSAITAFLISYASFQTKQEVIINRLDTIAADVKQIRADFYKPTAPK